MDVVVVTGFGPFGGFAVNASWEVAKGLRNVDFESSGVKLVTEEVKVAYDTVEEKVPQLWEMHAPKLMVHIGVSAYASEITLETCARKDGYKRPDVEGKLPEDNASHCSGPECINTCIDLEEVSLQFNILHKDVTTIVSNNAGQFLCEFIYYNSLCVNPDRTVFIHVPPIDNPYTVPQMSEAVQEIILLLLDQLRKNNTNVSI